MPTVSIFFLFLWSEFCYCRAVWCLTWDGLYCPMKTWLSREVGRQFNSCQCIGRRYWIVWKASSLPHHPTLFFFTKIWRKDATWEGRERTFESLKYLVIILRGSKSSRRSRGRKKPEIYLTGQESLTFYYFCSPNYFIFSHLFVSSASSVLFL